MKRGQRRCKGGLLLLAAPCALMSHLLVMCHSFFGWFSWLGVVGRVQNRFSVLSVPPLHKAELGLGAQSWGELRDLTGSTFFFYTTQRCKAALQVFFWATLFVSDLFL